MTALPTPRAVGSRPLHAVGESSGEHALAAALIELLASSPSAMQRLVDLLEDRGLIHTEPTTPVYTVASLAEGVGVSAKVVRGAIARGELDAVMRGGRWIIPAEAVDAWAHPPAVAAVAACGSHGPSQAVRSAPRLRSCRGGVVHAGGYDLL